VIPTLIGREAERDALDARLRSVRAHGCALLIRGEAGIGKTALLDYAAGQAEGFRVIRTRGVESEMELPHAGLHLLSAPLLDGRVRLQSPQREALETAVGLRAGPEPDRLLVGLGTLTLLSSVAEAQPLLCVVDDAQWLDRPSAQVLAFVARRLNAQPIVFLLAERDPHGLSEFHDLPELVVGGCSHADAHTLLASAIPGRLDESVVERIIAETGGNPRAILELSGGVSPADLAGGFGMTAVHKMRGRSEEDPLERLTNLPPDSRRLLLVAAAEPVGDPALQWRAAARLGISTKAAQPLESKGLLSLGLRVRFCRPRLRSAIYGAASIEDRRDVHRALALATDPASDPDRRAWHLAHAANGPDEELARELEGFAARARDRGGIAAAAAFLEHAALLTIDPELRAERALVAASAKHEAGAPDAAARLLVTAELGRLDESQRGRLTRQRAQITFASRRGNDAPKLLLGAARQLEPLEPGLARETYLEAIAAAIFAGRLSQGHSTPHVAEAARLASPAPEPLRAIDRLLDGLVARFTKEYSAAIAPLTQALEAFCDAPSSAEATRWLWLACRVAGDLWHDEAWHTLTNLEVQLTRDAGAMTALAYALTYRAIVDVHCGDFAAASALVNEADAITAAMGNPPLAYTSLILAAWRGQERRALRLFEQARQDARERGEGITLTTASYATAVLCNGLGRYDEALAAARDATEVDEVGLFGWSLVELIEAAARSGQPETAALALQRLAERTRSSGTDWALGVEARSRALLSDGQAAEDLYQEAIERLGQSRIKVHLARAQLVYGEWLRRQGRRIDARAPLRAAREFFTAMGAEAFTDRAHRELLATGETARNRVVETRWQLTPQETQIAFLARDGLTNIEIGARLFVSPRTVEWHMHKVFAKLGITSRAELHLVLADVSSSTTRPSAASAPRELAQTSTQSHVPEPPEVQARGATPARTGDRGRRFQPGQVHPQGAARVVTAAPVQEIGLSTSSSRTRIPRATA
jgi:DNA-binding CsgD family transcriptional regulator